MSPRDDLTRIFTAAVAAVEPQRLVRDYLRRAPQGGRGSRRAADTQSRGRWLVVGAGKAAAQMAAGCEAVLGADSVRGLVITADGAACPLQHIECVEAGHPIPDERGHSATTRLTAEIGRGSGPLIVLISGGASALLVQPAPAMTLADKVAVTRLLLKKDASIEEINTVRKHLSAVKGGGLLRLCPHRPLLTLIISDVIGDAPYIIGSGPSVPDPTTYGEALGVLRRHGIEGAVPASVRSRLEQGAQGRLRETVKPGDPEAMGIETVILADNRTALTAAAREAERLGYRTIVTPAPLCGETRVAARTWWERTGQARRDLGERPWCLIAGGETTVDVRGNGRGGRNQEFALALVDELAGRPEHLLSAGTDGIDGPTDAAGAFVDGTTLQRALRARLSAVASLEQNDAYRFFGELGDLFCTGPTGTNVMDIKIALRPPG